MTGTGPQPRRGAWLAGATVVVLVAAIGLAVVQPFSTGPVGFDSASSVVYFQRLLAGQRLEAFVTTTPKPLLTAIYGLLYSLVPDWRVLSFATIGAFSLGVALVSRLALRVAGPAAAAFVVVGLVGLQLLQTELVYAYAVPWALLGWASAGLLATGPQPRYGWAGVALLLAALARVETLVLPAMALVALVALSLWPRLGAARGTRSTWWSAPPRRAWLLLVGFGALPVMLLHDWLLTGDPFFWIRVSQIYSAADPAAVDTAGELLSVMLRRYLQELPLLSGLALLGGAVMVRRRNLPVALGLIGLGPGVAAFLLFLGWRHTYVSTRYFAAVDVAVVVAAAVGVGVLAQWLLPRVATLDSRLTLRNAVAVGVGLLVAIVAHPLLAPLDPAVIQAASVQRQLDQDADASLGTLRAALAAIPDARAYPPRGVDWRTGVEPPPILLAPGSLRPRLVADLDMPLSGVAGLAPGEAVPGPGFLGCADLVFHDRAGDGPGDGYAILEIQVPTTIGDVRLTPLVARPDPGIWIVRVSRTGAAAAACRGPAG